jgi:hypothetical protein
MKKFIGKLILYWKYGYCWTHLLPPQDRPLVWDDYCWRKYSHYCPKCHKEYKELVQAQKDKKVSNESYWRNICKL